MRKGKVFLVQGAVIKNDADVKKLVKVFKEIFPKERFEVRYFDELKFKLNFKSYSWYLKSLGEYSYKYGRAVIVPTNNYFLHKTAEYIDGKNDKYEFFLCGYNPGKFSLEIGKKIHEIVENNPILNFFMTLYREDWSR